MHIGKGSNGLLIRTIFIMVNMELGHTSSNLLFIFEISVHISTNYYYSMTEVSEP